MRADHDLPPATSDWGWKFHHIGIPTKKKMPCETYLEKLRLYVSGFDTSPFGIEWMRFEKDSPVNDLVQAVPHVAFEVSNIDLELSMHDFQVLSRPESYFEGMKVAMIEHNGAPIELIEFEKNK
ncbi:MAG TPA: hypothetical protein ENO20_03375 [Bacteroides sp.]|nr:hypothetical protein [Bacteroides sp.]